MSPWQRFLGEGTRGGLIGDAGGTLPYHWAWEVRGPGYGFLVDVQAEVMHGFVHECLVSFIAAESGVTSASHTADPSAYAAHPR
jgi:hypothetical protein